MRRKLRVLLIALALVVGINAYAWGFHLAIERLSPDPLPRAETPLQVASGQQRCWYIEGGTACIEEGGVLVHYTRSKLTTE